MNLSSFVNAGLAGILQASGNTDGLDIGFKRPSPGFDDKLVSLIVFGDVDPGSREIWPGY